MTWNLFHGRDWPPEPELQVRAHKGNFRRGPRLGKEYEQVNWDLLDEFASLIDSVDWDVALFQEFPPSWKNRLAENFCAMISVAPRLTGTSAPRSCAEAQLKERKS